MKKIFKNKTFITIVSTIIQIILILAIYYAIGKCISGNINIKIGINS